jgi:CBS domain-containing protein
MAGVTTERTDRTTKEIATTAPSIVSPDMKLSEARELMKEKRIGRLLVANDSDETRSISEGPAMGTPERAEGGRT